jgi:HPt (histidine-containing phosphotransfer) domain-containing protein
MGTEKLYDLSTVASIGGGDPAFVKKMAQLFIDTMPKNFDDMNVALQSNDWVSVGKLAHKMKATIDSMAIVSIQQDIRTLEQNGKNSQSIESIPSLVERITSVLKQCIADLKSEFGI